MELHDWIILLLIAALVVYTLAVLLINAWHRAKRHHRRQFIREFMKEENEVS